jgi:ankyrin repeat protein
MLESEYHECDELFPLLLAKGADPWLHAPDDGDTALHLAASLGRTEKCAMLLAVRGGRTVDLLNDVGVTPLMKAAAFGHLQTGIY